MNQPDCRVIWLRDAYRVVKGPDEYGLETGEVYYVEHLEHNAMGDRVWVPADVDALSDWVSLIMEEWEHHLNDVVIDSTPETK
jgi:hypothetical protein